MLNDRIMVRAGMRLWSLLAYAALVVFALKSCTVSMDEPFKRITFHEIVWQIIVPSNVFTVAAILTFRNILNFRRRLLGVSMFVAQLVVLLFVILCSLEALYGYYWDLSHYTDISWR